MGFLPFEMILQYQRNPERCHRTKKLLQRPTSLEKRRLDVYRESVTAVLMVPDVLRLD